MLDEDLRASETKAKRRNGEGDADGQYRKFPLTKPEVGYHPYSPLHPVKSFDGYLGPS